MILLSKNGGHLTDWTTLALSEIPSYTEVDEMVKILTVKGMKSVKRIWMKIQVLMLKYLLH